MEKEDKGFTIQDIFEERKRECREASAKAPLLQVYNNELSRIEKY